MALACAAALPATAGAATGSGGASAVPVPVVTSASCAGDCAGVRTVRPGSVVRLRGRALDTVAQVVFLGGRGRSDDVAAEVRDAAPRRLEVTVPRRARSGRLVAINVDGAASRRRKAASVVVEAGRETTMRKAGGGPEIDVEVSGKRVFFDGRRKARLTYLVQGSGPTDVVVELLRLSDGVPVARWTAAAVQPGTPQTVRWSGRSEGVVQPEGRYEFRVFAEDATGARAQSAQAPEDTAGAFTFLRHKFPVRGRHDYGTAVNGFGGGRGHEGHDVFAACGTRLVAARGGTVKHKATHGRAGNYIVIDGHGTGEDYAYMHLRDPALVEKGDRVKTGQLIGYVGDTGRAHGCHLHFELWSAPGWYTGGSPIDPLPALRAWDANS